MSIESCSFLRPSIRAKLQDSGMLFLDDLLPYFRTPESLSTEGNPPVDDRQRASFAGNTSAWPSSSNNASASHMATLRCDDALASSLHARLPSLGKDEVFDLIASTAAYVAQSARESVPASLRPPASERGAQQVPQPSPEMMLQGRATSAFSHSTKAITGTTSSSTTGLFIVRTLADIEKDRQTTRVSRATHATTFCRSLDALLGTFDELLEPTSTSTDGHRCSRTEGGRGGKGVEVGKVTEVSGPPGVGKTQLMLQLAVSCAMPLELGGLGGDCLYLDTEGGFVHERFVEVAHAAASLVRDLSRKMRAATSEPCALSSPLERLSAQFTVASVLSRVHYVRVADVAAFVAALHSVAPWAAQMNKAAETMTAAADAQKPDASGTNMTSCDATTYPRARSITSNGKDFTGLRMLIIDSVAGPFRATSDQDATSMRLRNRLVAACGAQLQRLATQLGLAVVVSNQVTSRSARLRGLANGPTTSRKRPRTGNTDGSKRDEESAHETGSDSDISSDVEAEGSDKDEGRGVSRGARLHGHRADQKGYSGAAATEKGMKCDDYLTYLVPSLGDAWAMHASTRLILSFHHYALAYVTSSHRGEDRKRDTTFTERQLRVARERAMCAEDVVFSRAGRDGDKWGSSSGAVYQHRVARLTKHDTNPRGECCFAISGKGIRDVGR